MGAKSNPPQQPPSAASVHAYSYIQQSGRGVKTMNAKNTKKSPIHENADANITCDIGDGDFSRFRSRLPHMATHIVSSIIVRWLSLDPERWSPRRDFCWQGYFWELYFREGFSRVSTKHVQSHLTVYSRDMAASTSCHHFAEQAVT